MTQYKRELQTIRDGRVTSHSLTTPLAEGKEGTVQTLNAMRDMVLAQRTEIDLQRFVEREIVQGVAGHDQASAVERIFEYSRDSITYRPDPFGVERVADIWSTLYALGPEALGDCGIKSCFFAACCALQGVRSYFVVIRQDATETNFDHVYAAAVVNDDLRYYDPTPENAPAGWQAPSVDKRLYDIFK